MRALPVDDERDYAAARKLSRGHAVYEGLEIRAEARGHDHDATRRLIFSTHFFCLSNMG